MLSAGSRRRALAVLLSALLGLALVGGARGARSQVLPIDPGSTTTTQQSSTTTTAPPPSSTTSTTQPGSTLFAPESTTTTTTMAPPPSTAPAPAPAPTGNEDVPAAPPEAGDGGQAPTGAGPFPPELQALTNSVRRTPANNTKKLLLALSPLLKHGLTEQEAAVVGFGRFPVAGLASYSHDWWYPRFGPGWRLHQGTDIFAAHGTPVRAPVDGTVKITNGGLGGLSVYVVQSDGTYWYLTHLAAIPEGLVNGSSVTTGQVVGFVGASGNAAGGAPHLHFEVHPGGGGAIDPKAVLDQFIADALALAPKVVEAYDAAARTGEPATQVTVPTPAPRAIAAALPPRAALLWATAVSPTGGAVQLAEAEAARVASSIDWSSRDLDEGPTVFDRRLARQFAAWWVHPLVHPILARHLSAD